MKTYQLNLKIIYKLALPNNLALPWLQRHKNSEQKFWITWAKPKSKCDFINYFWVAKTWLALQLITTAYQGNIHFSTTAVMRLNTMETSKFNVLAFCINQKRRLCPTFRYCKTCCAALSSFHSPPSFKEYDVQTFVLLLAKDLMLAEVQVNRRKIS